MRTTEPHLRSLAEALARLTGRTVRVDKHQVPGQRHFEIRVGADASPIDPDRTMPSHAGSASDCETFLRGALAFAERPKAVYLRAPNDRNGNPRRGWLVYLPGQPPVGISEGYRGRAALTSTFPEARELCSIEVSPREYRNAMTEPD